MRDVMWMCLVSRSPHRISFAIYAVRIFRLCGLEVGRHLCTVRTDDNNGDQVHVRFQAAE